MVNIASVSLAQPLDTIADELGRSFGEYGFAVVRDHGIAQDLIDRAEAVSKAFFALPADVNAETVAAFLPQIFTRLNQYAGEMKLGDVDDLLFTTRGAHCLIYRLGTVYFAVLGKPGQSLPWNELRLVAAELSRQVQK